MKLTVTDIAWGIDRKTGKMSEKVVGKYHIEFNEVGPLHPVGPAFKVFEITELIGKSATIQLNHSGKSVTLTSGEEYEYHPVSRDGGHIYILKLK
ncbi:MAG: hypothetical protein IKA82_00775 [Clostridia bacterium]|nr:hypothetical protein [Clostridia bacterium]